MRIEYHRTLAADRVRNEAFFTALSRAIRPGETTVADIGAGTGILALMAARLGAREVFLYEAAAVASVAARVLERNGAGNCHLFPCHSTEMLDPPLADVVVSETLGNYPFEEDIIETLNDARRRILAPGGVLIPRGLVQYAAPVISARLAGELAAWDRVGHGLDLSPAKEFSLNNVYVRTVAPSELLDHGRSAQIWDSLSFLEHNQEDRSGTVFWRPQAPSTIHGFATWWVADLGFGVSLSTAPDAPATHWEQLYFPLSVPLVPEPGGTISLLLSSRSSREMGTHLAWEAQLVNAQGKAVQKLSHDLDWGYLP